MPRFNGTYPTRICPTCGQGFTPTAKRQVYCKTYCRTKAYHAAKKGQPVAKPESDELGFMMDEIRRIDAVAAADLMQMATMLATAQAQKLVATAYRLMNRGGYVQAKNVLIEAGVIAPTKPRSRKIKSQGK
jgi:hypothetical protein